MNTHSISECIGNSCSSSSNSAPETPPTKRKLWENARSLAHIEESVSPPSKATTPDVRKYDTQLYCLLVVKILMGGEVCTVSVGIGNLNNGKNEVDFFGGRSVEIFENLLPGAVSTKFNLSMAATILSRSMLASNISKYLFAAHKINIRFELDAANLRDFPAIEVDGESVPAVNCAGLVMRKAAMDLCFTKMESLTKATSEIEREESRYFGNFNYLTKCAVFHVKSYEDECTNFTSDRLDVVLKELRSLTGKVMELKVFGSPGAAPTSVKKYFAFTEHERFVTMDEYMNQLRVYGMSADELVAYGDIKSLIERRGTQIKLENI